MGVQRAIKNTPQGYAHGADRFGCVHCGSEFNTTFLGSGVYSVRCKECKKVSFVIARNASDAERKIGKFIG